MTDTITAPFAISPWDTPGSGVGIARIPSFQTAPGGSPLLVVEIETDQDGLVRWGCESSPQRPLAIKSVIDNYLDPILRGRNALDIDDIHHLVSLSPFWRGGAIENKPVAGVDFALWDITSKMANMPVFQLLGGQVRTRIPVYGHADGRDHAEVIDRVQRFRDKGYEYLRCQIAIANADTYGTHAAAEDPRAKSGNVPWLPRPYVNAVPAMFEAVRYAVGWDVEFLHDVHKRGTVSQAIRLARDLEPYKLFFLEDAIAPDDFSWYREMRDQTVTPQAVGEVFFDIQTFISLVVNPLIDFVRIRTCAIGGLTPTVKLANLCDLIGGEARDPRPRGCLAAGIVVEASSRAFGIQESIEYPEAIYDVFPEAPCSSMARRRSRVRPGSVLDSRRRRPRNTRSLIRSPKTPGRCSAAKTTRPPGPSVAKHMQNVKEGRS